MVTRSAMGYMAVRSLILKQKSPGGRGEHQRGHLWEHVRQARDLVLPIVEGQQRLHGALLAPEGCKEPLAIEISQDRCEGSEGHTEG